MAESAPLRRSPPPMRSQRSPCRLDVCARVHFDGSNLSSYLPAGGPEVGRQRDGRSVEVAARRTIAGARCKMTTVFWKTCQALTLLNPESNVCLYSKIVAPNNIGYIAQWLERLTADQQVPGSNPGVPSYRLSKY